MKPGLCVFIWILARCLSAAAGTSDAEVRPAPFYQNPAASGRAIEWIPDVDAVGALVGAEQLQMTHVRIPDGPGGRDRILSLKLRQVRPFAQSGVVAVDGAPVGNLTDTADTLWSGRVPGRSDSDVFLGISRNGSRGWIQLGAERFDVIALPVAAGAGPVPSWILPAESAPAGASLRPLCGPAPMPHITGTAAQPGSGLFPPAVPPGSRSLPAVYTAASSSSGGSPAFWEVSMAIETDWQFYQKFGSVGAAQTYATQLFGAVAARFQEQVSVKINLAYLGIHSNSNDGWVAQETPGADLFTLFAEFQNKWKNGGAPVAANLYHLFSGWNPATGASGVATFSNFCAGQVNNDGNFATTTRITGTTSFPVTPSPLASDYLVAAHEVGHNFRAIHTHGYCPPIDQCAVPASEPGMCYAQQICTPQTGSLMSYCTICPGGPLAVENYYFHPQSVADMRAYLSSTCVLPPAGVTVPTGPLAVFPMALRPLDDARAIGYVDLNPAQGFVQSFDCQTDGWDGTRGTIYDLSGFDVQQIGVPVFAVADGLVVSTKSNVPDWSAGGCSPTYDSNFVQIHHGNGLSVSYRSLRQNSVLVAPGDRVRAGQQIALVGSSECLGWPRNYVEWSGPTGFFDPHTGACQIPPFPFKTPIGRDTNTRMQRFYFSRQNPAVTLPPLTPPTTGQYASSDTLLWYVTYISYLPPNSKIRHRILRPNGTAFGDWTYNYGNAAAIMSPWYYWTWTFGSGALSPAGTWTVVLDINDVNVITAPFDVVASINPNLNRAPKPVTVAFVPVAPTTEDPVQCVVTSTSLVDDLDYDLVRYRYKWKVGGNVVRDVVSAARSDVLPHHVALDGATLVCEVTPNDGKIDGSTTIISVPITPIANRFALDSATFPNSRTLTAPSAISAASGNVEFYLSGGVPFQPLVLGYSNPVTGEFPFTWILPGNPGSIVLDLGSAAFWDNPEWLCDPSGRALIQFRVAPDPGLAGQTFALQWIGYDPSKVELFASHALRVTLVP